jgi:hypothetical protein
MGLMNWLFREGGGAAVATGSVTERSKLPHERWPEILDWQTGDEFDRLYNGTPRSQGRLVAIQPDGFAVLDFIGERFWASIPSLIGRNVSLRTRRVNASLKESAEYMELLNHFQQSVRELEARDKQNGVDK